MRPQRVHLLASVAVIAVAVTLSLGATCRSAPRHTAHLSLNAFAHALLGVQQGELALYQAGQVSAEAHATITAKLVTVATLADQAQVALDLWTPGDPVPRVVGTVMTAAKDLVHQVLALIPADPVVQANIQAVYDAIADVLILVAGGA